MGMRGKCYFVLLLFMCSILQVNSFESFQTEKTLSKVHWTDWQPSFVSQEINADSTERVLVLLAKSSDLQPEKQHTSEYFDDLLFGDQPGSMEHYYIENSRNQIQFEGQVSEWVQLDKTLDKYDEEFDDPVQEEYGLGQGIEEVIQKSDSLYDYSYYDQNNDGIVDNLMVIFVGEADSSNGDSDGDGEDSDYNAIWPLKWQLQTDFMTNDGVSISNFFVCVEVCTMGTFAHEFAHNLGLPDLYDSDYSSQGVGDWSVMGFGNYLEFEGENNPSHFDPWSKYKLGWITPTIIDSNQQTGEILLNPIEETGECLMFRISPTEYFLVEYRSKQAGYYDKSIPASGILIWQIDESIVDGYDSFDNSDESRPVVRLLQADGYDDLGMNFNNGDTFDVWTDFMRFDNSSTPSSVGYEGDDNGIGFTISEINEDLDFAILSFDTKSVWFYEIDWNWDDSTNDGFMDEIVFSYDIDGDSANIETQIIIYAEGVLDNDIYDYKTSNHTINLDDVDEFETRYSIPTETQALIDFTVILYVDGKPMDSFKPEYHIWLESPEQSNQYDEWFEQIEFTFQDWNNDNHSEFIDTDFKFLTTKSSGTLATIRIEVSNPMEPELLKTVEVDDFSSDYEGSLGIDLQQSRLRPGLLNIFAFLEVNGEIEEIFHWSDIFWWEGISFDKEPQMTVIDGDFDGYNDTLAIEISISNNYQTNEIALGSLLIFDLDPETGIVKLVMEQNFVFHLGPPTRQDSDQSYLLELDFSPERNSTYAVEMTVTLPGDVSQSESLETFYLYAFSSDEELECDLSMSVLHNLTVIPELKSVSFSGNLSLHCLEISKNYNLIVSKISLEDSVVVLIYDQSFIPISENLSISIPIENLSFSSKYNISYSVLHDDIIIMQEFSTLTTPQDSTPLEGITTTNHKGGGSSSGKIILITSMLIIIIGAMVGGVFFLRNRDLDKITIGQIKSQNHNFSAPQKTILPNYSYLPGGGEYQVNEGITFYFAPDGKQWQMRSDGSFIEYE